MDHVTQTLEKWKDDFYKISEYIGNHPELGHEEFKASAALVELLKRHGFDVTTGIDGIPTSFEAVYRGRTPGPHIAFMAEYDALPGLGHACGHNLIGTMAAAAAIAASKSMDERSGSLYVYGTPAEETRGAKVPFSDNGIFDHLDAAMMIHPYSHYEKSGTSLAMDAVQFSFEGKSSHAAASPEKGINALDAVINTFNSINTLRQHVPADVRIHGIITEGGQAANIVPDYAEARFYVRAGRRRDLDEITEKVKNCARGASLAAGTTLDISNYEFSYDDMTTNETLSTTFTNRLVETGVELSAVREQKDGGGSLDMGNVSHVVPSIHPYIQITDEDYACHTPGFEQAARSRRGFDDMLMGAAAMAMTALDLLDQPELLHKVKDEFNRQHG